FAFSPWGKTFVTIGRGDSEKIKWVCKVHDTATGDLLWKCPLSEGYRERLAIAPDRRTIAVFALATGETSRSKDNPRGNTAPPSKPMPPLVAGIGQSEVELTLWDAITGRRMFLLGTVTE